MEPPSKRKHESHRPLRQPSKTSIAVQRKISTRNEQIKAGKIPVTPVKTDKSQSKQMQPVPDAVSPSRVTEEDDIGSDDTIIYDQLSASEID